MLVNLRAIADQVTDYELLQLSSDNPDTKFEKTKEGKLVIMPLTNQDKQVEIYRRRPRADEKRKGKRRKGQKREILANPANLKSENVLPGLTVDLTGIL